MKSDIVFFMKIASWNVNSIKARLPLVLKWLDQEKPDVLMMQELKGETATFPSGVFEERGYFLSVNGQKSYNGVAIASRYPLAKVDFHLLPEDPQARYLEAEINGIVCVNIYAPNGNPVDSDKYTYKLAWSDALIKKMPFIVK